MPNIKHNISRLQLSVKGKVLISFLTAVVCALMAWVVMHTVFNATLHSVDQLSKPNSRQVLINRIYKSISKVSQSQYVQFNVKTATGHSERFVLATQKLESQLDSLLLFGPLSAIQQTRIDSMKLLIVEHRNVYTNYIKLKSDVVKSKTLTKRINLLKSLISQSAEQIDSSVRTSQHKTTTRTDSVTILAGDKPTGLGFWATLFKRKPKNETELRKTITEEYNFKIDTLYHSQQDSLIKAIDGLIKIMTDEQHHKGLLFIEKERALLSSGNIIVNRLFSLMDSIKEDESAIAAKQSESIFKTIGSGMFRLNTIVLLFFCTLGVLSLLIVFDISKSNAYKKALQESKEEAERLAEVKQRFLSNMSHEIRTPLQSILGFAEQAKKQNAAEPDTVNAIYNSSAHLLQIVNEILDYSRLTSGNITLVQQPFSLDTLTEDITESMRIQASAKGLQFYVKTDFPANSICIGDAFRIKQVLYNIIGNAIKFTPEGAVSVTATAQSNHQELFVEFIVKDSGIGISDEQKKYIFEEFEQADPQTGSVYGGTGLGLAIVKELVQRMNGTIVLSSEPNKGSIFTLCITLQRQLSELNPKVELELTSATSQIVPVWLVDDDAYIRKVCSLIFESNQIPYRLFASAHELISQLNPSQQVLYVLDIRMPEVDGITLCKQIKEQNPAAKTIALTAQALPDEHQKLLSMGFDAILTKPFYEKELLELLRLMSGPYNIFSSVQYDLTRLKQFTLNDEQLMEENLNLLIEECLNDLALLDSGGKQTPVLIADTLHRLSGRVGLAGAADLHRKILALEMLFREAPPAQHHALILAQVVDETNTLLSHLHQEVIHL